MNEIPLFPSYSPGDTLAWWRGHSIDYETFLSHVNDVAEKLPQRKFAINLCEDRFMFLVSFVAAMLCGQTNLLPPNRAKIVIEDIANEYRDSYCLTDNSLEDITLERHRIVISTSLNQQVGNTAPNIPADHIAAIVFTSGSTGRARPNSKSWYSLMETARLIQIQYGINRETISTITATVPPQHMYGLEMSISLPLRAGISIVCARPFFPEDIRLRLEEVPGPHLLVTTPIHLKSCVEADFDWPEITLVISATAPLSILLAQQVEQTFDTQVLEIYGCSETGSIASRRTTADNFWHLYEGITITEENDAFIVHADHLFESVTLSDYIDLQDNGTFKLQGRHSDLVNIAGKRGSLGDLNHKLLSIEGVKDGAFIMPDTEQSKTTRLTALVVAPGMTEKQVTDALSQQVDPAFLPRPIYLVDRLPRNETGKLPKQAILAMIDDLKKL